MLSATHQKRPVNSKLLSEMWSCWNTDAINRSARNVILRAIQRDNLIFTRGGKRVKISRSLQVVIDNSWESFLSSAVDSAFVSGCVVYFFQRHPTQKYIPVAATPGSYNLFITKTDCSVKLEAEPVDPESTQELFVWDGFGWGWDQFGQPSSPCASILPIVQTIRSYIDTGLKADALASNPTIVTAQKQRQSSNVAGMEEYSLYAEAGMVIQSAVGATFNPTSDAAIVQEEDRFRLDRLAVEQTLAQRAVFHQFKRALEHDDATMLPHKKAEEARTIFPLPSNAEIQRQLPASANSRMTDNIVLQQETQCSILGIPRSFLLSNRGGNTGATAVAQQSNSIVSSTIQWWRVVLGRLLTVVYHQIYGTEDAQSVVKQLGRKRKFNAVDAFEENFVEVHFTEDSAGGLETLLKLYQFGVISFERFSSCALRIAGMDQDNSSPQEMLQPEDKLQMAQQAFGISKIPKMEQTREIEDQL